MKIDDKMTIGKLAKKYYPSVTKRDISYWCDRGYLKPKVLENGYFEFDEESEKTLKKIIILKEAKIPSKSIKAWLKRLNPDDELIDHDLRYLTASIKLEYQKTELRFDNAFEYLNDLLVGFKVDGDKEAT